MAAQKTSRVPDRTAIKRRTDLISSASRLRAMYDRLVRRFGPQQWWPAKTRFEVVIGAFLTQNTAWKSVERSITNLESRGVLSIDGIRRIRPAQLRELIRPSGFMVRKAMALKAFVAFLDSRFGGQMDSLSTTARANRHEIRGLLLELPGIGPETADAILLYALDAPAIVVDEYLRRIAVRHSLVADNANYAKIQALAEQAFAPDSATEEPADLARHYNEFHALVVQIGKMHCRRVPLCGDCPLAFDLPKPVSLVARHKMKS